MRNRIAVVDEANHFVRWEERHTIHEQCLPHRSIHVLIFNQAGQLFLQRRHRNKQTFPQYWDNSVAGHVEESDYLAGPDEQLTEVYRRVAMRELQEELGVHTPLVELGAFSPQEGIHYEHFRLYKAHHEGPFLLQEEEVEEGRWSSYEAITALSTEGSESATPLLLYLIRWVKEHNLWGLSYNCSFINLDS